MADFLGEFVKTVVKDIIQKDYPHIQHPALLYAQIIEAVPHGEWIYTSLQILTENKEVDETFPVIPYVKTEFKLQPGDIVVIGLLYGDCVPYILGRCLDDID